MVLLRAFSSTGVRYKSGFILEGRVHVGVSGSGGCANCGFKSLSLSVIAWTWSELVNTRTRSDDCFRPTADTFLR